MSKPNTLSQLADEYDRAEANFPDYRCPVRLRDQLEGTLGPCCDPRRKAEAFWRFKELSLRLYPLLEETGVELITNKDATPDGSLLCWANSIRKGTWIYDGTPDGAILFWALKNEFPPAAREVVVANCNPFWQVAVALRQLIATETKVDSSPKWDKATEARNKWLYKQCCKVVKYSTIESQLKSKPEWGELTIGGIKNAANAYAKRHELQPIPARQNGRPKKK